MWVSLLFLADQVILEKKEKSGPEFWLVQIHAIVCHTLCVFFVKYKLRQVS